MIRLLIVMSFTGVVLTSPATSLAADPFWASDATDSAHEITVYRSASCGCCKGWVSHLRDHHFIVEEVVTEDLAPLKAHLGVRPEFASCHTAVADGHVFEGHVPANDIKAVLEGHDAIRLLTVPAMPSGTPGMDFPGARKDDFAVIAVDRDGATSVYRTYSGY